MPVTKVKVEEKIISGRHTRHMDDIRDVFAPFNRREQGDPSPRRLVMIARDAYDAHIGGRRVILDYMHTQLPLHSKLGENSLVSEAETAPQPTSPKFAITLCLSADHICLLLIPLSSGEDASRALAVADGHGMSSTRSHLF